MMARIGVQRGSLNHRMRACVTLCHSLCAAAQSPAIFRGNLFIPLMRLDIYDHMLSIILISGPFAGHRRTSIAALARNPSLQSLLTHPLAGSATAREIFDFIGPDGISS